MRRRLDYVILALVAVGAAAIGAGIAYYFAHPARTEIAGAEVRNILAFAERASGYGDHGAKPGLQSRCNAIRRGAGARRVPTFVDIAGGPKGDGLKQQIEAGQYPNIVKTTLDGFDQRDYLEGKTETSARDVFCYYSAATPSAVRYKNWKMYYTMAQPGATGWIMPLVSYHFTLPDNIKRDPFEQAAGTDQKTAMSVGGSLGAPMTAFQYDFNILPLGQQLWLAHLETFQKFPPLQAPESYNLSQVYEEIKKAGQHRQHS